MDIQKSIVAILDKKKKIIGTGFVAGENLILTCAHVVEAATSTVLDPTTDLNIQVTIRFAIDGSEVIAQVDAQSCSPGYEKDVALLRVDTLPQGVKPLPLAPAAGSAGHDFYAYGYATVTNVQGIGARGKIVDIVDNGRLVQLTSQEPDHGMSGGPVLDEQRGVVVGMVTKGKNAGDEQSQRNIHTSFATATEVIFKICHALKPSQVGHPHSPDALADLQPRIEIGGGVNDSNVVVGDHNISNRVTIHLGPVTVIQQSGVEATRMQFNPNHTADVSLLFFPHPDAQLPELTHLIGHRAELLRLLQHYDVALREGRGALVFITGQPGYGTKALGRTLVDAIRKGNGRAAVTRFWPDDVEKRTRRDPRWKAGFEKYAHSLENAPEYLTKAEFAPFWPLAFQVWGKSGWGENEPLPRSPRDIPAYLRQFVTPGKPLVLLLEDFEHASPAWLELLRYLTPELALGLPLVLIVTFHAEKLAEQIAAEACAPAESLALELAGKNLAELMHLSRVTPADVADYIAPAHPEEAERLTQLIDGLPILVQQIWEIWQHPGTLVKDKDGLWQLAPNSDWRTCGTARDYVNHTLEDLWPDDDEAPWPAEKMMSILTLAAQEGPTFTSEALALACDVDPAQLIYALEYLLDDPDDPGLLQVDEPVDLKLESAHWHKRIERWRFSPMLSWYALQTEPPEPADLEKLAEALRQTYWPFVERCAADMARLYEQPGNSAQAVYYRGLIQKDDPCQVLMNQAEMLLDGPQKDITYSRLWTISSNIHFAFSTATHRRWAQGFYKRVWVMAKQSGWADFQAETLLHMGYVCHIPEECAAARAYFERVLQMEEELGDKGWIGGALHGLGHVSRELGDYSEAQVYFERALKIFEELERKADIAANLSGLGEAYLSLGEYGAARAYFERALQMAEELGNKNWIANSLFHLGEVYLSLGEYGAAQTYFERALQAVQIIDEAFGRKNRIAVCWYHLGRLALVNKNYDEARDYHLRALKVFQDEGRKYDVAANIEKLGDVEKALGNIQEAEAYYLSSLAIFTEIGTDHRAEGVRRRLAALSTDPPQEKPA